jgi:receptor expression-enhancing protein 5/6
MLEEESEKLNQNDSKQTEDQQLSENIQDENTSEIKPEKQNKIKVSIVDKWKEIMKAIKDKTGIDGIYVIIFLLLCVILVYLGIFGSLITNLIGTLYPGFSTIKSIEKKTKKKEWLTYWVVYGSFIIVDMFSNIIMKVIPFYFVFKILFLIWMILPGSNGCALVYNFLIFKLFKSIENTIDFFFAESKDIANQLYKETKNVGGEQIKKIALGLKTFKGLGLGKKNELEENMETIKQSETQKYVENPLYGKIFNSTIDFLGINKKKKENNEKDNSSELKKSSNLNENIQSIKEEKEKKEDEVDNKNNKDKKEENKDEIKEENKDKITEEIKEDKKEENLVENEDEIKEKNKEDKKEENKDENKE